MSLDQISSYTHSIKIIIIVLAIFIAVGFGLRIYGSSFLPQLIWVALGIFLIAYLLPIL